MIENIQVGNILVLTPSLTFAYCNDSQTFAYFI